MEIITISKAEFQSLINESLQSKFEAFKQSLLDNREVKPEKEFITRAAAREMLDISLVTLNTWVKKGVVTKYKLGNRTYFKYSEIVQSLLKSNPKN